MKPQRYAHRDPFPQIDFGDPSNVVPRLIHASRQRARRRFIEDLILGTLAGVALATVLIGALS